MAQGDYLIQNQSFPSFRSDLNATLEAINTSNSGTSRPTSAVAGTVWLDVTNATNPTLKFFDGTDDISLAQLDYSANTVNWLDSSVVADLVNDTTPQLGGDLDVNGNDIVSVSNGNITFTPDGTGKVIIDGLSFPTSDGTADQVLKTDGAGNLSFGDVASATNPFRNIIINGDMSIAQRSTSETGQTSSGYICLDRFRHGINSLGTWTISQSTDVPTGQGFANSMKMDCTTADASPSAGDYLWFEQRIEGKNLQYLKKGTASAESVTVSFWVKATKTGTNIVEFSDKDNTRHICQSYTINSSNTWEKKTITFAGDTSGAFTNDNNESASLIFWIGAGSNFTSGTLATSWASFSGLAVNRAVGQVNHADSTSNNFYLTGIQMEAGTSASDFEFLPTDVNFERCRRYCFTVGFTPDGNNFNKESNVGSYYTATTFIVNNYLPTIMRASPSTTFFGGSSAITVYSNGSGRTSTSVAQDSVSPSQVAFSVGTSSATSGHVGTSNWGSGDYCLLSAEL